MPDDAAKIGVKIDAQQPQDDKEARQPHQDLPVRHMRGGWHRSRMQGQPFG